jgi:voltage-gated potassium channel
MGKGVQARTDRILERIARKPLKGAWLATAVVSVAVTVVAGILIRITDPDSISSVGAGLWWAVQTTTTVGYGDLVPQSIAGRVIAALVMVVGIGFITVSTAAIASAFVEASRRRRALDMADDSDDADQLRRIEELQREQAAEMASLKDHVAEMTREIRRLRAGGDADDAEAAP